MLDLSKNKLEVMVGALWNKVISRINNIKPTDIGAANTTHTHGVMKTISFSATEPTAVNEGEIIMVYEE
ncbi:MAG: hypothetical protein NC489_22945 [Ruminococcus flavefaciens]|nr:hypothetical protein [Ruminococcus flavefaciens]